MNQNVRADARLASAWHPNNVRVWLDTRKRPARVGPFAQGNLIKCYVIFHNNVETIDIIRIEDVQMGDARRQMCAHARRAGNWIRLVQRVSHDAITPA